MATCTGERRSLWDRVAPQVDSSTSSTRVDLAVALPLYLLTAAVYLEFAAAASGTGILAAEETAVSFVDVVALDQRFQFTHFSTNFGAHVLYWLAAHVWPSFSLFYGREFKAVAMALVAPLVYLTLRRRLGCAVPASVVGAVAGATFPGVLAFSWVAIDTGLEEVVGLVGLYVVTARHRWWVLGPLFAAGSISVYAGGITWALAILLTAAVRALGERGLRPWVGLMAAGLAGLGLLLLPLWWWRGGTILTGGGSFSVRAAPTYLHLLVSEEAGSGHSYYYFTDQPALGSWVLAVVLMVAVLYVAWRVPAVWPWLLVGAAAVGVYAVSGGIPGVRRVIAVPLVAALVLGVALDRLVAWTSKRNRPLGVVTASACALALLGPLAYQAHGNHDALSSGRVPLPHDFAFPMAPQATMPETLDKVAARLRRGVPWSKIAQHYDGAITASMLLLLKQRGAIADLPVTGNTVERLYREGPRCETKCTPVPGRA